MSCGIPWDTWKCELRACAGLILSRRGAGPIIGVPKSIPRMPPKTGPLRRALRRSLSSRVMVVFFYAQVCAIGPAVSVRGNTLSNNWGLLIRRLNEMEHEQAPDFPDMCAEQLSVDAWHLVECGCFVRDEDILLLETRSALRAVQSAALDLSLTKGRTRSFPCAGRHPSYTRNRIPCQLSSGFSIGAV